jgi:DNA-binding transcriptional ArsR family regulator
MGKEGRNKISANDLLKNVDRMKIFQLVSKQPLSISQIADVLKINRGTLRHHLSLLVRNHILRKEEQKHLAGKPVLFYPTINPDAESKLMELLKHVGENNPWHSEMKKKELHWRLGAALAFADFDELIDWKIKLTPKGVKYLEEHNPIGENLK